MKHDKTLWILIAAFAAAVAAATTIVIIVVRARQKMANIVEPIFECDCCDEAEQCACESEDVENVTE